MVRILEKERMQDLLTSADMSLADAVRKELILNQSWPEVPPERYDMYPDQSAGVRVARVLVESVAHSLRGDPRRESVLERLTCELAALEDLEPGWEFSTLKALKAQQSAVKVVACE
jgi:hypothetical protein